MFRTILATGFLAVLMGGELGALAAGSDDSGKASQRKKVDPDRQLVFKVTGLT